MIPAAAFYLIRHGESEANLAGKAAGGGVDSPLTVKGEEQASALADVIENLAVKPSAIFVSPMKRAIKTADIINTHLKLPVTVLDVFEVHHVGYWEGRPWSEIGPYMKAGINPPNGENYDQYAARVKRVLAPVLSQTFETPPLFVAHGGTFYMIGHLYGWKIRDVKNCHLHLFDPYPGHTAFPFRIKEYNVAGIDLRECRSSHCPTVGNVTAT